MRRFTRPRGGILIPQKISLPPTLDPRPSPLGQALGPVVRTPPMGPVYSDGRYGGIYADSSWDIGRNWSAFRREKNDALRKGIMDNDLGSYGMGQVGPVEEWFHRVFGARGLTGAELETATERGEITTLHIRMLENLSNLSDTARGEAVALSAWVQTNVLQRYPDSPSELLAWRANAARAKREMNRYLPINWLPYALIGAGILALGYMAYTANWFGVRRLSRINPKRRPRRRRWVKGSRVQTLLFPKASFTKAQAKAWARGHGYKAPKVDAPRRGRYLRVRQVAPGRLGAKRTITFGKGIKAVVGQVR